jgi:hypothetical protein
MLTSAETIEAAAQAGLVTLLDTGAVLVGTISGKELDEPLFDGGVGPRNRFGSDGRQLQVPQAAWMGPRRPGGTRR